MKKKYSKQNRHQKRAPQSPVASLNLKNENFEAESNKKLSKNKKIQTPGVPSQNENEPRVRIQDMKFVAYKDLFPSGKMKTGTQIIAAFQRYDFNKKAKKVEGNQIEEDSVEESSEAELIPVDRPKHAVSSKKYLFKKLKGGELPKSTWRATKLKGYKLPRDPIFHLRYDTDDPWYPDVPGIDCPLDYGLEPIADMSKPYPRDPEEEAELDKLTTPTKQEIFNQIMSKKPLVVVHPPEPWKPGEMEEVVRTRTTMADLKHFYETGELIVRE